MRGGTTIASGQSRRASPAAHRRPHAVRLGLVARREHDPAADDHRAAAQARVVALLDRREERVRVGVQDRPHSRHEHMFAEPGVPTLRSSWNLIREANQIPELLVSARDS